MGGGRVTPEEQIAELEERVAALERAGRDIQTQLDMLSDWVADIGAGFA